jgi:hypothetical protein
VQFFHHSMFLFIAPLIHSLVYSFVHSHSHYIICVCLFVCSFVLSLIACIHSFICSFIHSWIVVSVQLLFHCAVGGGANGKNCLFRNKMQVGSGIPGRCGLVSGPGPGPSPLGFTRVNPKP